MLYQNYAQRPVFDTSQIQGLLGMIYNNSQPGAAQPSFTDQSMMPGNTAGAGMHNAFGGLVTGIQDIFANAINEAKVNAAAQGYGG